jgi:hypothetical protein
MAGHVKGKKELDDDENGAMHLLEEGSPRNGLLALPG